MESIVSRLSRDLLIPEAQLRSLARSAPYRYKVYTIPKKTAGERRTIAQPAREVKILQRWIVANVLADFPVHPSATAYLKGRNILDNARRHLGTRFLLKLDFKDFFPSIVSGDLRVCLQARNLELSLPDLDVLCRILFWRPRGTRQLKLSIGAPSSPALSNVLLYDFDSRIAACCDEREVRYTRYVDDLTFSSNIPGSLQEIHRAVREICGSMRSPQLQLNEAKMVGTSKKHRRRVTGLLLTNDGEVSLGRDKKRAIRAGVHQFSQGRLDPPAARRLGGLIAFAHSVEPDFVARLIGRYGVDVLDRLRHGG